MKRDLWDAFFAGAYGAAGAILTLQLALRFGVISVQSGGWPVYVSIPIGGVLAAGTCAVLNWITRH